MTLIRILVLTIAAVAALCSSVFSIQPTAAPQVPNPASVPLPEGGTRRTPILIMARSIRIASSLDSVDALLASLQGKGEPDCDVMIRCDKIEVVHASEGSAPEIECFGDVMITAGTMSIQAERVLKRGNVLVFEGVPEAPSK